MLHDDDELESESGSEFKEDDFEPQGFGIVGEGDDDLKGESDKDDISSYNDSDN